MTAIKVRRITDAREAIQWDGKNTDEVVEWLQGGWKDDGAWLKQTFENGELVWYLVTPNDNVVPVGGWLVRLTGRTEDDPYLSAAYSDEDFRKLFIAV